MRSLRNVEPGCHRHEMANDQHVELLATLTSLQGMVVVCGYTSALYEQELSD